MEQGALQKTRFAREYLLPVVLLLFGCFVLVLLVGSGGTLLPAGLPAQPVDMAAAFPDGGAYLDENGSITVPPFTSSSITLAGLTEKTHTLGVHTAAPEGTSATEVRATLYLIQTDAYGNENFIQLDEVFLNPAGRYTSAVLRLRSEAPGTVRLYFSDQVNAFTVTGLTLNESGFAFNFPQFFCAAAAVLAVWLVWKKKWHRATYNPANLRHWGFLAFLAVACIYLIILLMWQVNGPKSALLWEYNPDDLESLKNPDHYTHYYHLFDAFKHGQLSLRTAPDAALTSLANPYDPAQRAGIDFLWDTAYAGGAYYTYFGPAPMPLYFLVFFLTGKLPSPAFACMVPAVLAALGCLGALLELLRYFSIKPNLLLLSLGYPALLSGSLLFMLVSCADTYVQPYLWAMAGLAGFLWAFFRALREGKKWRRGLLFAFAGLCAVFIAAARPAALLLCLAFALPPGLRTLRDKTRTLPARAPDITWLFVPLLAGGALLMAYNTARFGSPFEFGNTLQLTVWDMRTQTFRISPVWLLQALLFFLFQPLLLQPRFPYVWIGGSNHYYYGSFFYNYGLLGLANLPLFWWLAAVPATLRRQSAVKKGLYLGVLGASALLLWFAFCVSNVVYRYICDVSLALGLLALLAMLEGFACRPKASRTLLYKAACFTLVATFAVGALLCFTNERNFILKFHPDTFIAMGRMLSFS